MKNEFGAEVPENGTPAAAAPTPEPPAADTASADKEQHVQEVVAEAAKVASPFLHSAQATGALALATGLSPIAIHLGFMLAHLFHFHKHGKEAVPGHPPTE